MRAQGRYLRFRHVFPELFGPGVQARRGLLRFRWFLLQRIDFRPMWTLGAAAGLGGVLLTVSLFFLQGMLRPVVAAREVVRAEPTIVAPPPVVVTPPTTPQPVFPPFAPEQSGLSATFERLTTLFGWSDRRLVTAYSVPQPMELSLPFRSLGDTRWLRADFRPYAVSTTEPFTPYREPRGLRWNSVTPEVNVTDVVLSGMETRSITRPTAVIEKQMPTSHSGTGPLEYRVIVSNPTRQSLPDVSVFEAIDVTRVTDAQPPARVEPNGLLWKLAGLAPGERRELSVTVWTDGLTALTAQTDVELADRVATVVQVDGAVEEPSFERTPVPVVEPPQVDLPAFPTDSDLPPFPNLDRVETVTPPPPTPSLPVQTELPAFPEFPTPAPQPPGRPILKLTSEPPAAVAVGRDATTWYAISNVGDGPARDIVLKLRLPEGLQHHDGARDVEFSVAELAAGQSRRARLVTRVLSHGRFEIAAELVAEDQTETNTVQLFAPQAKPIADERPDNRESRVDRKTRCRCCQVVRLASPPRRLVVQAK